MFETFPPKLTELVLDDEWNKANGTGPPCLGCRVSGLGFRVVRGFGDV